MGNGFTSTGNSTAAYAEGSHSRIFTTSHPPHYIASAAPLTEPEIELWPNNLPTGMYGPPLHCKRKKRMTVWSAQMYPAFV
jgi:hypothetical protein